MVASIRWSGAVTPPPPCPNVRSIVAHGTFCLLRLACPPAVANPTLFQASQKVNNVGFWTHLAIVYSAVDRLLTLYVDGAPAGSVPYRATWNASGPLVIGMARIGSVETAPWAGDITSANVYAGAGDISFINALQLV
jgi:hypothetical protein